MILTPHLLIGAALVSLIDNIPLALTLAFLSHYALDVIPHWDYATRNIKTKNWRRSASEFIKIFADFFSGIILLLIAAKEPVLALAGAFLAVLPDAVTFFVILFPKNNLLKKHGFLHGKICHWFRAKSIPLHWKLTSQIIVGLLAIWAIL